MRFLYFFPYILTILQCRPALGLLCIRAPDTQLYRVVFVLTSVIERDKEDGVGWVVQKWHF